MTDDPPSPEQMATLNDVSFKFEPSGSMAWAGRATCKHGITRNTTFQIAPGVPPLNHAGMVDAVRRQHQQVLACDCPNEPSVLNATVTFQPANAVPPGQQRYVPQQSATIPPPAKNFFFGPRLTCLKLGAYQVVAKVQLSRGLTQGAGGLGVIVVSGVPVLSVPMIDEATRATANIDVTLNLAPNQSVEVGYENTSAQVQDVTVTTLTVSEVWVP